MTISQTAPYGIGTSVNLPFVQAVERVKEAFKAEGFGTLTEIDVRKTLQEKIGEEIEPYTILGVCNPNLASRAIRAEPEVGLLLPCNVLVRQSGGKVSVSAQDPSVFVQVTGNETMRPVAEEAKQRMERALASLGG